MSVCLSGCVCLPHVHVCVVCVSVCVVYARLQMHVVCKYVCICVCGMCGVWYEHICV